MVAKKEITTRAILLGLAILVGSCSNDVQPAFLIKAHVKTFAEDRWVIVSDENGGVLDLQTGRHAELNQGNWRRVLW